LTYSTSTASQDLIMYQNKFKKSTWSFCKLCEYAEPFISKKDTNYRNVAQCSTTVFHTSHQCHIRLLVTTSPHACNIASDMQQKHGRPCCITCCKQAASVLAVVSLWSRPVFHKQHAAAHYCAAARFQMCHRFL
jgi:hypothetical protein